MNHLEAHPGAGSQPKNELLLPDNSIFTFVNSDSLIRHLQLYISGQSLSQRHVNNGIIRNPAYIFGSHEGLFPNEIQDLSAVLSKIVLEQKNTRRITRANMEAELAANQSLVILPKSGRGRGWSGLARAVPTDYQVTTETLREGEVKTLNLDEFIVFSFF